MEEVLDLSAIEPWPVSTSLADKVPVTAVETSSVAEPVVVPVIVAASLAPLMVIVTVIVSLPSELVTTNVSVVELPAGRALTTALELINVYVQVPLDTPKVPYPFTLAVPALTFCRVFSPESTSVTVGVPDAGVFASSVTEPVLAPEIEAASLVLVMVCDDTAL